MNSKTIFSFDKVQSKKEERFARFVQYLLCRIHEIILTKWDYSEEALTIWRRQLNTFSANLIDIDDFDVLIAEFLQSFPGQADYQQRCQTRTVAAKHFLSERFPEISAYPVLFIDGVRSNPLKTIFQLDPGTGLTFFKLCIVLDGGLTASPLNLINVWLHEYFHIIQENPFQGLDPTVYLYLTEGIASYLQEKYLKLFFADGDNGFQIFLEEHYPLPFEMAYPKQEFRTDYICYPKELEFVKQLVEHVGEDFLLRCYHQGTDKPLEDRLGQVWLNMKNQLVIKSRH